MMSLPKKNFKRRLVAWVDDKRELLQDEVQLAGKHKILHFFYLIFRNFDENRCLSRAGAMTFSTILAIVPTLAIVIGLTTVFQEEISLKTRLKPFLMEAIEYFSPTLDVKVEQVVENDKEDKQSDENEINKGDSENNTDPDTQAPPPEGVDPGTSEANTNASEGEEPTTNMKEQIVDGIMEFTENLEITKLGLFGFFAVLGMIFSTLITIESVMNDIWETNKGRAWPARLMSYWVVISVSGVLLVALTTLLAVRADINQLPGGAYISAFGIILFIALGLTFLYRLMPNAKVKWFPALVGGLTAAVLIQLNKMIIPWIITGRAERDSQIYGSFVAVTLFMFGIYIAWVIVLFGAQVAATFQNRRAYLHHIQSKSIHQYGRETGSFKIMTLAAKYFAEGKNPPTYDQLAKMTKIPGPLIQETINILIHHHLLRTVGEGKMTAIVPARPVDQISCFDVLNAMRCAKGQNLSAIQSQLTKDSPVFESLLKQIGEFRDGDKSQTEKITIGHLLDKVEIQSTV